MKREYPQRPEKREWQFLKRDAYQREKLDERRARNLFRQSVDQRYIVLHHFEVASLLLADKVVLRRDGRRGYGGRVVRTLRAGASDGEILRVAEDVIAFSPTGPFVYRGDPEWRRFLEDPRWTYIHAADMPIAAARAFVRIVSMELPAGLMTWLISLVREDVAETSQDEAGGA